jgi:DNA-binding response OmpR family regulator
VPPLILIVEDEKILAESMAVYLERHAYATMVAHAGEDGVRMAEENNPDVAVVDLRLPGIDGLEVLERLREVSPGIEVILATAHASDATPVEAKKRGAFDYLNKPVDLAELKAVLDRALAHLPTVPRPRVP